MKRYLTDLLRPDQLPGYVVARWMVSNANEVRRSGRTLVLAAAHLTEAIEGRTTQLFDHADQRNAGREMIWDRIRYFMDQLGLQADTPKSWVLRKVSSKNATDPRRVLRPEDEMVVLNLRSAVVSASKAGFTDSQIERAVRNMLRENLVDEVHDL